jgi:predicted phage terminase large subunit-like protein
LKISLANLPSLKEIQKEKARRKLIDFITYTKPDYRVNWHHRNIANVLDKFVKKEIKRVMIFTAPRHGKSEIVSRRSPAFILGKNPNARIIGTSYSQSLASSMSKDVQRIIDSKEYHDLFPKTTLVGSPFAPKGNYKYSRTTDYFEVVNHDGYYLSAGVGGSITGRGADYAIIDDPVKNRQEAESLTYRDRVFDWFTSTLYTRLEKDACVLITLTRWHEDDLAGRLLRLAEENPKADQWYVINYPAIFDEKLSFIDPTDPRKHGEALWPEKYNEEKLNTIKATIGSYEWNALYQQTPSSPEGSIIKRSYFRYYIGRPSKFDEIIQSWDFAFDKSDDSSYVVGQVWGRIGADKYLLDQVRDRMTFTESLQAFKNLTAKYSMARAKYVENKANGPAIINTLRRKISGIIPVKPEGTKVERLYAVSPQFEAGNVYIPDPSIAHWVNDYVEELVSFPYSPNNDQVDCTTQALSQLEKRRGGAKVTVRSY